MADAFDQVNLLANQNTEVGLRTASNTNIGQAQSFVPTVSGFLQQIDLALRKVGSPTGAITVGIYTDSGGFPSSTQVGGFASDVDPATVVTGNPPVAYTAFTWASSLPKLTAGTTYWLVLTGNYTVSGSNYIGIWYDSTGAYSSGKAATFNSTWSNITSADFIFRQYINVGSTAPLGKKAQTSLQVGVKK